MHVSGPHDEDLKSRQYVLTVIVEIIQPSTETVVVKPPPTSHTPRPAESSSTPASSSWRPNSPPASTHPSPEIVCAVIAEYVVVHPSL